MQKLIVARGDVLPSAVATLTDMEGNPLDLNQATVTFRLVNFHTGQVYLNKSASTMQNNGIPDTFGVVAYNWQSGDTNTPGLYKAYFIVDYGNGPQTFPPDGSYLVLIS